MSPRGRAGLEIVPPEEVRRRVSYYSDEFVAAQFRVSARTVRRWKKTGLPLFYRGNPTREEWNAWLPSTGRTSVDRQLSKSSSGRKLS